MTSSSRTSRAGAASGCLRSPTTKYFTLAPDWVCEVLSPSTARVDRFRKLPVYAREGVQFVWLLEPIQRSLEVFELVDGRWTLVSTHLGDETVRARPFEALALELSALWLPGVAEPEAAP